MSTLRTRERLLLFLPFAVAAAVFTHPPRATAVTGDRASGAKLFRETGCEHCHGVDGVGGEQGPPIKNIGKRWKRAAIERQIREGGGAMPEFGDVLSDDEVNQLLAYLRAPKK